MDANLIRSCFKEANGFGKSAHSSFAHYIHICVGDCVWCEWYVYIYKVNELLPRLFTTEKQLQYGHKVESVFWMRVNQLHGIRVVDVWRF